MSEESRSLLPDSAIQNTEQDRLDRAPFAKSVACSIRNLDGHDSFVIGLCGPWGSGKTSILNLALNELESQGGQAPIVIRFNPWWFSGRHQLLDSFLSQFAAAIELPDQGAGAKKVATLFSSFSKVLRPFSFIDLARKGSDTLENIGNTLQAYADAKNCNVHEVRKQIDDALLKFDRRIIVVMDDIDRLSADEIAELFLILKAVADFPKTVYLLAFDHKVVCRAIRHKLGVSGKVYLEKIVQLQIEVPSVGYSSIHQLFLESLDSLLDEAELVGAEFYDFGNIFHDGVKQFLTTPRAAKKLTNILRFSFPSLRGEVYFPDFLGVATLFAFAPSVAQFVANNSEQFTGAGRSTEDRSSLENFHKRRLEKVEESIRPHVTSILERLFPRFAWALGGSSHGYSFDTSWKQQLRICSDFHFDKYFRLAVPTGAISEAEWAVIVETIPNSVEFERRLRESIEQKGRSRHHSRCREFLDRLDMFVRSSDDIEQIAAVFTSVLKVCDELIIVEDDTTIVDLISINNEHRVIRILLVSLERIPSQQKRTQLIESSIKADGDINMLVELIYHLGEELGIFGSEKSEHRKESLIPEADVRRLTRRVSRKISAASKDNEKSELYHHPNLLRIVRNWSEFGSKTAIHWLRRQAENDEFLVKIINQAAYQIRSMQGSDVVSRNSTSVNVKYLSMFFDLKKLKKKCRRILHIAPAWMSDAQRSLLVTTESLIGENGEPLDERGAMRRKKSDSQGQ